MTASFWRALDLLGSDGVAAADWGLHLGEDWDAGRAYLRRAHRIAGSVIDPRDPPRRLNVEPDGEDSFVGVGDDVSDLHPPVELSREDLEVHQPDWDSITVAIAEEFGFAGNRWESSGHTRKIGTSQHGSETARPVVLCMPPGHLMRQVIILRDLAARRDATVLIPSSGRLSSEVDALAKAHGLTIVGLVEHFEASAVREASVPYLATPESKPATAPKLRPVLKMQSGWTWDMLTIEVAIAGRLIFSCEGQREDVRLPKSKGTNHSEGYEILFNLAFSDPQEFHTPATWEKGSGTIRRRLGRLREQLGLLFPAPDGPFAKKRDRVYVPRFELIPHRDLTDAAEELRSGSHS